MASASREQDFVVFRPFEEVEKDSLLIPLNPQLSLARHRFSDVCEAAINEQIKYVLVLLVSLLFLVLVFDWFLCYLTLSRTL